MRLRYLLLLVALISCVRLVPARAAHRNELWRSPLGTPRFVSVSPLDSSVWAAIGSRVYHFDKLGAPVGQFGLFRPRAAAVSPADGSVWVLDDYTRLDPSYPNGALMHYTPAGVPLSTITGFWAPRGLVVAPDSSAWVLDGSSLLHFTSGGAMAGGAGLRTDGSSVTLAADGTLWCSFPDEPLLAHYSAGGNLLWERGQEPFFPPPGETHVAVNGANGTAWMTDRGNGHLLEFSPDGSDLWRQGGFSQPTQITIDDSDSSIWMAVTTGVVHLSPLGGQLWSETGTTPPPLPVPTPSLAVDPSDHTLWVTHGGDGWPALMHYGVDGTVMWKSADSLSTPTGAALRPSDGSVWVADRGNNRLVHYAPNGSVLGTSVTTSPLARPDFVLLDTRDGSVLANDRGAWGTTAQDYLNPSLVRYAADGTEAWRSASQPGLRWAALNASDGTVWAAYGGVRVGGTAYPPVVVRYAADGSEAARYSGSFVSPLALAVDSRDGTCWLAAVTDAVAGTGGLIHIGTDGAELGRCGGSLFGGEATAPVFVTVGPKDGAVWAAFPILSECGCVGIAKFSSAGEIQWIASVPEQNQPDATAGIAVDPATGFAWVTAGEQLVLFSNNGTCLWSDTGYSFGRSEPAIAADHSVWLPDTGDGQLVHVAAPPLTPFDDIPSDFWARAAIAACAAAGIVQGYPDNTYRPDPIVGRDQMAVYLARAVAGGDANVPVGPAVPTFTDVPTNHWAYRYIEYAAGHDLALGYPEPDGTTTFRPGMNLDRAQMAVFIARAVAGSDAGVPPGPGTATFRDVDDGFWAYRYIEYLAAQGIVEGYEDLCYHPEWPCTRDQMAVFIARAFRLVP